MFGEFPENWSKFVVVPLHKKGSINDPGHCRGIAFLEVIKLEVICINILNRRATFFVNAFHLIQES